MRKAQVFRDANSRPLLVFAKGRTLYHAVIADDTTIKLTMLDSLRGLTPLTYREEDYPPKRAASFWLNHSVREITRPAKAILRNLVARNSQLGRYT